MAEYIEREAAVEKIDEICRAWRYTALMPLLADALHAIPAAKVQPMKIGRFTCIDSDLTIYEFTCCGNVFYFDDGTPTDNNFKYCPFCGATLWGAIEE